MPARWPTSEMPESQLLGAPTASLSVSSARAADASASAATAAPTIMRKDLITPYSLARRRPLTRPEPLAEDHTGNVDAPTRLVLRRMEAQLVAACRVGRGSARP